MGSLLLLCLQFTEMSLLWPRYLPPAPSSGTQEACLARGLVTP